MSYHKTCLGAYGGHVRADIDGYVHLTIKEVLSGNWDSAGGGMTRDLAREIARDNRKASAEACSAIEEWQQQNNA